MGQYGYVPLGRHFVFCVIDSYLSLSSLAHDNWTHWIHTKSCHVRAKSSRHPTFIYRQQFASSWSTNDTGCPLNARVRVCVCVCRRLVQRTQCCWWSCALKAVYRRCSQNLNTSSASVKRCLSASSFSSVCTRLNLTWPRRLNEITCSL